MNMLKNLWNDNEGATAVEYGLIIGLIAVTLIIVITQLGTSIGNVFSTAKTKLDEVPK